MAYERTYSGLRVCSLTPEQHARTCDYWYTVTGYAATAHTAFTTAKGLFNWLEERGLSLDGELPARGEHKVLQVIGTYKTACHMDYSEFYNLPAIAETKTLSNGDYTLALITQEEGIRTIHTLNPNCRRRQVFDYRTCADQYR